MNGKLTLYVDQYGTKFYSYTVKDLRKQINNGGSRVNKMYVDRKKIGAVHIGYVIGDHWLRAYRAIGEMV